MFLYYDINVIEEKLMVGFNEFEEIKLNKLTSRHFPYNPASGKVLEKAGFKREGVLRSEYLKDRQCLDAAVFGYLREDFIEAKSL